MQHIVVGFVLANTDAITFDVLEALNHYCGIVFRKQQISYGVKDIVFLVDVAPEQIPISAADLPDIACRAAVTTPQAIGVKLR
jgi:hypothetical protein